MTLLTTLHIMGPISSVTELMIWKISCQMTNIYTPDQVFFFLLWGAEFLLPWKLHLHLDVPTLLFITIKLKFAPKLWRSCTVSNTVHSWLLHLILSTRISSIDDVRTKNFAESCYEGENQKQKFSDNTEMMGRIRDFMSPSWLRMSKWRTNTRSILTQDQYWSEFQDWTLKETIIVHLVLYLNPDAQLDSACCEQCCCVQEGEERTLPSEKSQRFAVLICLFYQSLVPRTVYVCYSLLERRGNARRLVLLLESNWGRLSHWGMGHH